VTMNCKPSIEVWREDGSGLNHMMTDITFTPSLECWAVVGTIPPSEKDSTCNLVYIGSTTDICKRWANTRKACLDGDSVGTGLYTHFKNGCPAGNEGGKLSQLRWTILDYLDTTQEKWTRVGHLAGPSCRCSECERLKCVEDKLICRMGSFYGNSEEKSRSRVNFLGQ
jgi:hypothetical protein